jgi:hypothetical protein
MSIAAEKLFSNAGGQVFSAQIMARKTPSGSNGTTAHFGFEIKLWFAGVKLRNKIDSVESKHAVIHPPRRSAK